MSSATDFAQLCRLCLVKEQVNVDIFEEPDNIRQIFHKISTCLPVKLSKEDKLPKRICEGCLYKLNIAYQFWNTSVNAEKQLLQWLKQSTRKSEADFPEKVKEEIDVPGNEIENIEDFLETSLTDVNTGKSETCVENVPESSDDEPLAKRRRRLRAQTRAAPPKPAEVIVGKVELNETDGDDNSDDPDDPNYLPDGVDMSDDNEQPGPSGLGTSTSDIPSTKQRNKSNRRKLGRPKKVKKNYSDDDVKTELDDTLQFKCRFCKSDKLFDKDDFIFHYKSQHKGKRLPKKVRTPLAMMSCEVCSKNFKSKLNLDEHMEMHNNQFHCEHCQVTFKKVLEFILHAKTHTEDDLFKCIYCEFKTGDINEITSHIDSYHETKHKFTCKTCNKGFDVLTWFKEHDNFHTGERPFGCEYCGKTFLYSRYLAAHRNSMHKEEITGVSKLHVCVVCKKQYQHKSSLRLHMNSHTGNVAICDVCGKQLSSKEKLKFHMRVHTGYKPFKCTYCEKSFTKKPILIEHMRVHTGERPYDCTYCPKSFSQRSSLVIHMRSHTGEKPYVCHVCNKGFVAKAMLNTHFKSCKGY